MQLASRVRHGTMPTITTLYHRDVIHEPVDTLSTEPVVAAQQIVYAMAHSIFFQLGGLLIELDKCETEHQCQLQLISECIAAHK